MFERKWILEIDTRFGMTIIGRYRSLSGWIPSVEVRGADCEAVQRALQLANIGAKPIRGRVPVIDRGFGACAITIADDGQGFEPWKWPSLDNKKEIHRAFA